MIATIIILTDALTLHYLIPDTDFSTDGRFSRLDRELSTSRLPQKSVWRGDRDHSPRQDDMAWQPTNQQRLLQNSVGWKLKREEFLSLRLKNEGDQELEKVACILSLEVAL